MKLDNNGWVMKEWLKYFSVILIFFILAIFGIIRLSSILGRGIKSNSDNTTQTVTTYTELEILIRDKTEEYIEKGYNATDIDYETSVISISDLVFYDLMNYPVDLKDKTTCEGYALVKLNARDELSIEPFIKCSNYKTSGYQDWRIE